MEGRMEVTLAFRKSDEDSTHKHEYEARIFEVPAVPRPGDRISFYRQGEEPRYFIVREIVWEMKTSVEAHVERAFADEITILCDEDPKPSATVRDRT
jgi:hypothetical protein